MRGETLPSKVDVAAMCCKHAKKEDNKMISALVRCVIIHVLNYVSSSLPLL